MPSRLTVALATLSTLWLSACAAPAEQGTPRSPGKPPMLRVATYNIKHGHGMDGTVDLERIANALRPLDADVILLQEVDRGCARSGGEDQAAVLGAALGMEALFGAFRPFDGGLYGMAALTRLPILDSQIVELPPGPNPLSCLEISLEFGGEAITVTGLHLVMSEEQRLAQSRFLVERYRDRPEPVLLAGDLNSERGSAILDQFLTAFDVPEKSASPLTFPSVSPVKEIDFVLLAPRGDWTVLEHRVIPETVASDHRPVLLTGRRR